MIIDATGWELEPTPWMDQAACAGQPPEEFFPRRGDSTSAARTVCGTCPVQPECLDYALRWNIAFGIWGGLSVRQRRLLQRNTEPRRLGAAHGTTTRYARGCRCEECRRASYAYQLRHGSIR